MEADKKRSPWLCFRIAGDFVISLDMNCDFGGVPWLYFLHPRQIVPPELHDDKM